MIGGQPEDGQPCRCHCTEAGCRYQVKGFQPIHGDAFEAIVPRHNQISYIEAQERSCSDSEHVILKRAGYGPSFGNDLSSGAELGERLNIAF